MVRLTRDEIASVASRAKEALDAAQTKEEVVRVWQAYYLQIGHRVLARLLLGQPVERAARLDSRYERE